MNGKSGDLLNYEVGNISETHKAIIGVSRLGELRHCLDCESRFSKGTKDVDNILELLNGTIAEINDQIDEVLSSAVCYLGNKN